MTISKRFILSLFIIVILGIALILYLNRDIEEFTVDIRGEITHLNQSEDTDNVSILVEGRIEDDTSFDKASIRIISGETKIFVLIDGKRKKGKITDLQENTLVEVDFGENPVAESYPVQTKAKAVVVLGI